MAHLRHNQPQKSPVIHSKGAQHGEHPKTDFDRYNITSEEDLKEAATRLGDYINRKKGTLLVTPDASPVQSEDCNEVELFERLEESMELATGIEPATCGLQNRCSTN